MSLAPIYCRRLVRLADFLEKLPPKRFDYNCWVGDGWGGRADLSCGTTACALGWATTMPEFRKLGLRLSEDGPTLVKYNESTLEASGHVFGLTPAQHWYLFLPRDHYDAVNFAKGTCGHKPSVDAKPKEVANHIRKFVKEQNHEPSKKTGQGGRAKAKKHSVSGAKKRAGASPKRKRTNAGAG